MGLEGLTQLELLQGILTMLSVVISIFIGFKITSKYFTHKKTELLTIGLMMTFVTSGWWGSSLAFILYAFFDLELSDSLYVFISFGFLSLTTIFWVFSFAYLIYPKSKWKIFSIWLAIGILYTIFFMYFLVVDPSFLVIRVTRFDSETRNFVTWYILLILVVSLVTQIIFLHRSLQSEDARNRWKGKFIFLGFIVFLIGSILDTAIPLNPISLVITRLLLITASILNYIGWTMPERIANWIVKE